jgi:hypothetical protein
LLEVVPAEKLMLVRLVAIEAVMVEPFSPKLTLLLLEKVMTDRLLDVVPAEKFTLPPPPPEGTEIWNLESLVDQPPEATPSNTMVRALAL